MKCCSWLMATLLTGCATTQAAHVAWPAPPAVERVRLVKTLSGQTDLEGGLARFWRRLSGADAPVRLYHPVGVAVTADGQLVAVTDQALAQLFLFDLAAGEVRTVGKDSLGGAPVGVALEGDAAWVVVPARKVALHYGRRGEPLRSLALEDCERPVGIAVDVEGKRLYVTDTSSPQGSGHTVHVHALDTGEHLSTLGQRGEGQGEFFFPTFVSLAPGGGVLVADTMRGARWWIRETFALRPRAGVRRGRAALRTRRDRGRGPARRRPPPRRAPAAA